MIAFTLVCIALVSFSPVYSQGTKGGFSSNNYVQTRLHDRGSWSGSDSLVGSSLLHSRNTVSNNFRQPYRNKEIVTTVEEVRPARRENVIINTVRQPVVKKEVVTVQEVRQPVKQDIVIEEIRQPVQRQAEVVTVQEVHQPVQRQAEVVTVQEVRQPVQRQAEVVVVEEVRQPVQRQREVVVVESNPTVITSTRRSHVGRHVSGARDYLVVKDQPQVSRVIKEQRNLYVPQVTRTYVENQPVQDDYYVVKEVVSQPQTVRTVGRTVSGGSGYYTYGSTYPDTTGQWATDFYKKK